MRLQVVLAVALAVAGCSAEVPSPKPSSGSSLSPSGPSPSASEAADDGAWVHYSGGLDFDHPATWVAQHHDFPCSFCSIEVELTQVATVEPCVTTGNSTQCNAFRGVTLGPGQVFAVWWHWGMAGKGVDPAFGRPILVGGREARLRIGPAEGGCDTVADRSFDVQIASPVRDNWLEFHACYYSVDATTIEANVQRMLASVHWND